MADVTGHVVLAIDPGREKCGLAVVRRIAGHAGKFETLCRGVISANELPSIVSELFERFGPQEVVVGDGTNSAVVADIVRQLGAQVVVVSEKDSTLSARKRFFLENPPKGWRRFIPLSLQVPDRAYDDYVAVILAERYFADMG
ncbi:MAG: hypothetical protein ACUVRS_05510 [Armatimonadota bacterium]